MPLYKMVNRRDAAGQLIRDPKTGRPASFRVEMTPDEEAAFEAARAEERLNTAIGPLALLDRFTAEEQLAIAQAAMTDAAVKLAYDRMMASRDFRLADAVAADFFRAIAPTVAADRIRDVRAS